MALLTLLAAADRQKVRWRHLLGSAAMPVCPTADGCKAARPKRRGLLGGTAAGFPAVQDTVCCNPRKCGWWAPTNVRSNPPTRKQRVLLDVKARALADTEHIGAALGTCSKIAHRCAIGGLTSCNIATCSRAEAPNPVPLACTYIRHCSQIHQTVGRCTCYKGFEGK